MQARHRPPMADRILAGGTRSQGAGRCRADRTNAHLVRISVHSVESHWSDRCLTVLSAESRHPRPVEDVEGGGLPRLRVAERVGERLEREVVGDAHRLRHHLPLIAREAVAQALDKDEVRVDEVDLGRLARHQEHVCQHEGRVGCPTRHVDARRADAGRGRRAAAEQHAQRLRRLLRGHERLGITNGVEVCRRLQRLGEPARVQAR